MVLHHFGYREHGPGIQPSRYVVARGVVIQRLCRNIEKPVLHLLERSYAQQFSSGSRITHDKVAETEVLGYRLAEIHRELFGILVKKHSAEIADPGRVGHLRRLYDDRHVWILFPYVPRQPQPGLGILAASAHERHVADHPEHIVPELTVQLYSLLVVTGKDHLGTGLACAASARAR